MIRLVSRHKEDFPRLREVDAERKKTKLDKNMTFDNETSSVDLKMKENRRDTYRIE